MKKLALLLAAAMLLLCAACAAEPETDAQNTDGGAEVKNPMVSTDAEGFLDQIGVELGLPDGAEDVAYFVISETLGEMRFTVDGVEMNARVQSADEYTDISGLYYTWDVEEDCTVNGREGKEMRVTADGKTIDLCLWYDVVPGLMYALSAEAEDLDGFDLLAYAEQVYIPMQHDVG